MINATDGELKAAVSACGYAALIGGLVLLAGLIIEARTAFLHLPYGSDWEMWGQVSVASGVGIELLFSHLGSTCQSELLRRTEEALAEAVRMAEDAWSLAEKAQDKAREADELARYLNGEDVWNDPD